MWAVGADARLQGQVQVARLQVSGCSQRLQSAVAGQRVPQRAARGLDTPLGRTHARLALAGFLSLSQTPLGTALLKLRLVAHITSAMSSQWPSRERLVLWAGGTAVIAVAAGALSVWFASRSPYLPHQVSLRVVAARRAVLRSEATSSRAKTAITRRGSRPLQPASQPAEPHRHGPFARFISVLAGASSGTAAPVERRAALKRATCAAPCSTGIAQEPSAAGSPTRSQHTQRTVEVRAWVGMAARKLRYCLPWSGSERACSLCCCRVLAPARHTQRPPSEGRARQVFSSPIGLSMPVSSHRAAARARVPGRML